MKRVLLVVALTLPAFSQVLVDTPRGVVVAHDGRIQLANAWNVEGVRNATEIAAGQNKVVLLDALRDEAVVVDLSTGRATKTRTAATPIAAAFAGDAVYILARDARVLQRLGPAGIGSNIELAADPAFLRTAGSRLYTYSRITGVIEEIENDRVSRRVTVAPFASDFEIGGRTGYLAFPRDARIRTVDLERMQTAESIDVGAVPVDIALAGGGTVLTARVLAVADPSAKRIWMTEGRQSTAKAIGRGFLRGFLGLGLYGGRSSRFPTGVDRVLARGSRWIAYDSSSGTLYRVTGKQSSVIAQGVAPKAFALTENGVAFWRDGRLQTISERGTSVAKTDRR